MADVACSDKLASSTKVEACMTLTRSLLLSVTGYGTDDGILLSAETVYGAVGVALGLGGLVLSFTLGVLVAARCGPRLETGHVADGLDDGALDGVVLTGGLAEKETDASETKIDASRMGENILGLVVVGGGHDY